MQRNKPRIKIGDKEGGKNASKFWLKIRTAIVEKFK